MRRARDLLLLLPLAACYLFISRLNPDLPQHFPIFFGFALVFVLLPALGFGGLLVRQPLSLVERLALGSPAALAALFALGYLGAVLRQPLVIWVQPALGLAACLASLWPQRRPAAMSGAEDAPSTLPPTSWGDLLLIIGVLCAGLALCLPKVQGSSLPVPGMTADYYTDDIITSAFVFAVMRVMEHGLPFIMPMVEGTSLSYHLLYHYCYAACVFVTAIHPMDLVIFFWPPLLWLFLAAGMVVGCRRLAGFTQLETFLASVLVLFVSGLNFYSSPSTQLFDYQHTFFLGLPALILFCTALYGYLSGRNPRLFAVHAALCFLVCASTKATLLLLLPASLLPVLLLRIVKRQTRAAELILAGLALVVVVALRMTIYPDTGIVTTGVPKLFKLLMGTLGNLGEMAAVLGPFVVLAVLALEANPVLRLKTKRMGQYLLFCATFVVLSAFLLKLFNFVGGDFYFYWQARVLVLLACAPVMAHAFTWRMPKFALAFALVLVLGIGITLQRKYLPAEGNFNGVPLEAQAKYLDAAEREGLRWAANNLEHRHSFFTNKIGYLGAYMGGYIQMPLFDYIGFSGLQGYAYPMRWLPEATLRTANARIKELDSFHAAATAEAKAEIMARTPVDYYLHCIRLAPRDFVAPDCLRKVYANESLIIYENACSPDR